MLSGHLTFDLWGPNAHYNQALEEVFCSRGRNHIATVRITAAHHHLVFGLRTFDPESDQSPGCVARMPAVGVLVGLWQQV